MNHERIHHDNEKEAFEQWEELRGTGKADEKRGQDSRMDPSNSWKVKRASSVAF